MKRIVMFPAVLLGAAGSVYAQEAEKNPLSFSGYAEVYYQQDFNNPKANARPGFVYSHNRNNEVSLNLGLIKAAYKTDQVRANVGIGVGSYMNANYAAEEGVLKNIFEANVGVKLSKTKNIWLDAGILPSHIGFESAIGSDCFTLTRSMMADNSPYFETGAKLSYGTDNGKWDMAVLVLNGWQRIQRVEGNSTPGFGHQIIYRPNGKVTFNSSSFIGNDMPDKGRLMRYFHNLYGQFEFNGQLTMIAGFDIGAQQKEKGSYNYNTWYTPVLIARYTPRERLSLALRGEYYSDKAGVVIFSETPGGFQTFATSLNVDYRILPNVVWRTELKSMSSRNAVFLNRTDGMKKGNVVAATAIAIKF